MKIDELLLVIKSKYDKIKSDTADLIGLTQKLDNTTSKLSNEFSDMTNPLDRLQNKLKETKDQYNKLNDSLKKFSPQYGISDEARDLTSFSTDKLQASYQKADEEANKLLSDLQQKSKEVDEIADDIEYDNAIDSLDKLREKYYETLTVATNLKQALRFREDTGMSYDQATNNLKEYKAQIDETKTKIKDLTKPILVPKTDTKGIKDVGDEAEKTSTKINKAKTSAKSLSSSFSNIGKNLKGVSGIFSKVGDNFQKGLDSNFRKLKKLTLGLIGVRTVMSMLTKSVNAYLSFDSELQESLTNSWNTLGALLAPAIELVARMFALATTYIAQFVNALTGIDLVARANAKALDTQAKATQKAGNAQRGLLAMDEITNLPTESASSPANQIKVDDTKFKFNFLDDLIDNIKKGKWHLVGETIGKNLSKALKSIPWGSIKDNAYKLGYNIADFLNGAFEFGWSDIGRTIGEGLNTALEFAYGFVEKFSFIQFGKGLADSVSTFFKTVDWEKLAETLSDSIIGLFDTISTFFKTVDWEQIGEDVKTFILNIKWKEVGESIADAIVSGIRILPELMKGVFGEDVGNVLSFLLELVLDNIPGMADDIKKSVTTALDQLIIPFESFVEGVKEIFKGNFVKGLKTIMVGFVNTFINAFNIVINAFNTFLTPFRAIVAGIGKVMGKDWNIGNVRIPNIPSLAVGTNYIEDEGLYHLHEGEQVVPKKYNPTAGGYDNSKDNREIINLLIALNSSMLEYAERPIRLNLDGKKIAEGLYDDMKSVERNKNVSTNIVRS